LVNFLKFFSFETQLPNEQKTLKGEKLTDDGRQVMAKAHISIGKVS
jgi:hypothetical protein